MEAKQISALIREREDRRAQGDQESVDYINAQLRAIAAKGSHPVNRAEKRPLLKHGLERREFPITKKED